MTNKQVRDHCVRSAFCGPWVALLGRGDEPTDAIRDYCSFLSQALARQGVQLVCDQVSWHVDGSFKAFSRLWHQTARWAGRRVLLQYTALSWSRHGFSFRVLVSLVLLKFRGVRCAIVFHDTQGYGGARKIDHVRNAVQCWIMRQAYRLAEKSIFAIPVENATWLPKPAPKAAFIAIGANLPDLSSVRVEDSSHRARSKTVVVFSLTGGDSLVKEVREIGQTLHQVSKNHENLNLLLLGRNSQEAEKAMKKALERTTVTLEVLGIVAPSEIALRLLSSDVLLFVRGAVTGARSSALAGVACGLPIVGYRGRDTTFPITEAGVELVEYGNLQALGLALDRVLTDDRYREELRLRSSQAYQQYYCWVKIAGDYLTVLGHA
jgi:glycosyltransferase involved in cell wall biosynthesis